MYRLLCLAAAAALCCAWDAQEEKWQSEGLGMDDSQAKNFLSSGGRAKRWFNIGWGLSITTTLKEECNEGCYWEEVRENKGNSEAIREYMRWYNCNYRTKCSSGYYCHTTGSDYSHNRRLSQACYRHGGWCGWSAWGSYGSCSVSCGYGTYSRSRSRSCSCPSRVGGGNYCSGSSTDTSSASCNSGRTCTCSTPTTPANSVRSGATSYSPGAVVNYGCVSGYTRTSGSTSRTCQTTLTWSGSSIVCSRKSCGNPGTPASSSKSGTNYLFGDIVTYTCNTGYQLSSGSTSRTCQASGAWSGSAPVCQRKSCGNPGTPVSSSKSGTNYLFGDIVTYTCNAGYQLSSGSTSRTCQASGAWSGSAPVCQKISCGDPGSITNGGKSGTSYLFGDSVSYSCNNGYIRASGSTTRTCQSNKTWSGTSLVCQIVTCGAPAVVPHSAKTGTVYSFGNVVSYLCNRGYTHDSGSLNRTCLASGNWSGSPPVCKGISCKDPGLIVNTVRRLLSTTFGSAVAYVCSNGYTRQSGNLIRVCLWTGTWSGTAPSCTKVSCGDPGSVQNSTRQLPGVVYQDTVSYTCDSGYEPNTGNAQRTCLASRSWHGAPFTCKRVSCGSAPAPTNAQMLGTGSLYTDIVSYTCNAGFEFDSGNHVSQCQANKNWNGTALVCKRVSCGDPGAPMNSSRVLGGVLYGSVVTYTCDVGYTQDSGSSLRTCQASTTWSGTPFTCKRVSCGAPSVVQNSQMAGSRFVYQDRVTYTCMSGYESTGGNLTRECTSSAVWSGQTPICSPVACSLPNVQNAYIHSSSYGSSVAANQTWKFQDQVEYRCDAGYRRSSGDTKRTCSANRVFGGQNLVCVDINECASSPCKNGGQCNNLVNSYSCTCFNMITGTNCEILPTGTAATQALGNMGTQTLAALSASGDVAALTGGGGSAFSGAESTAAQSIFVVVLSIAAAWMRIH